MTKPYEKNFPDFTLAVVIPLGFEDSSWCSDTMPNWFNGELDVYLWIDYSDKSLRASTENKQYSLQSSFDLVRTGDDLIATDNYDEILAYLKENYGV